MSDFALLLRLRLRHVWSRMVWWAGTAGADLQSGVPADRAYAAYLTLLLGSWVYLMTGAAIDLTFETASAAGAHSTAANALSLIPAVLVAAHLIVGLRATPLKLGFADMAYVVASPVSRVAVVAAWFAPGVPLVLVGGGALGLLAGVAASTAPGPASAANSALPVAALTGAVALGARLLGWAAGLARFGGMNMVRLSESSSAYAQYEVYRPLALYDASAAADIRQRIRLATRRPRGTLPGWSGSGALIARAVISHVRQPGTLVGPLVLGVVVVPFGTALLATRQPPMTLLAWLFMVVTLSPRGTIRVHQASAGRPWLHHLLRYDELTILALHSAPALAVALCSAAAVTATIAALTRTTPLLILLSVMIVAMLMLCQGLGTVIVPPLRKPIDYPASALATAAMVAVVTFAEGVGWGVATAAGCILLLALSIRTASA